MVGMCSGLLSLAFLIAALPHPAVGPVPGFAADAPAQASLTRPSTRSHNPPIEDPWLRMLDDREKDDDGEKLAHQARAFGEPATLAACRPAGPHPVRQTQDPFARGRVPRIYTFCTLLI
jgi:hypothetical protein